MASIAVAGVGTVFVRWNGTAWEAIAEINSITGPSMGRETIDVTSLDTEEGYRQFITGFKNGGTVVLAMNFTRDTYELMKDDFEVDDPHDYGMVLPDEDETVLQFSALVTELPMTIPADDKVTADVTLQITGEVKVLGGELSDVEGNGNDDPEYLKILMDGNTFAWYLADEAGDITVDGSNKVSLWEDHLGSGNDLIQETGANQPTLVEAGENTHVLFNPDGSDQHFMATGAKTLNQPVQIYMIFRQVTWVDDRGIFGGNSLLSGDFFQKTANGVCRLSAGVSLDWVSYGLVWRVMHCAFDGINSYHTHTTSGKMPTGDAGSANMSGLILGKRGGPALQNFGNFEIKEWIIRTDTDSEENRQVILDYLIDRLPED